MIKTLEGTFRPGSLRFCLISARWNSFIVEQLERGACDALLRHGVEEPNITVVRVPGAFEIPLAVQRVASKGGYDALIALGAIIRGGTPHFDYVAGECVKGIAQVSLTHSIPIGFGVLTTDTIEQAIERAGTKAGNKGAEAALSALEMASLIGQIG